jgi:hypothetical protein
MERAYYRFLLLLLCPAPLLINDLNPVGSLPTVDVSFPDRPYVPGAGPPLPSLLFVPLLHRHLMLHVHLQGRRGVSRSKTV